MILAIFKHIFFCITHNNRRYVCCVLYCLQNTQCKSYAHTLELHNPYRQLLHNILDILFLQSPVLVLVLVLCILLYSWLYLFLELVVMLYVFLSVIVRSDDTASPQIMDVN
jgi:hypothetical protein